MKTFLLRNKCYVKSFLNFLKSFHEAPGWLPVSVECAKFRESRAIVGLMGLVPPCHRAFMGPKLSGGYFLGPKFFLVDICWSTIFFVGVSWVQYFFVGLSSVQHFSCGHFMGPIYFLSGISWVQNFMAFNKLR